MSKEWKADTETVFAGLELERISHRLRLAGKQADRKHEHFPGGNGARWQGIAHCLLQEARILQGCTCPWDDCPLCAR